MASQGHQLNNISHCISDNPTSYTNISLGHLIQVGDNLASKTHYLQYSQI